MLIVKLLKSTRKMQIVVTNSLNREKYIFRSLSFISDKFPRRRTLRLSHSRFVTKFSQWGRDISSSLEIICLAYLPELCSIWTDPTNLKRDNCYILRWGEIYVYKYWWDGMGSLRNAQCARFPPSQLVILEFTRGQLMLGVIKFGIKTIHLEYKEE